MSKRETYRVPSHIIMCLTCGQCNYFDRLREMCTFHEKEEAWIPVQTETKACFDYRPINLDYTEVDSLIAEREKLNQLFSEEDFKP